MDVQMRWLVNGESMDGPMQIKRVFWCTESHAQHYIQHRLAELIAPSETKPAAPSEVKEAKKSLVEEPGGHSTDSAKSSASGKTQSSSVSQQGQVLTTPKRNPSTLTLPHRK
tara:strand:- start:424 stop:759 length:336 start_codon:yes stop_codon:yes gene_type:complete